MKRTIEKKEALKNELYAWVEMVLNAYETDHKLVPDTFRMIRDVDSIIAKAFDHATVLGHKWEE